MDQETFKNKHGTALQQELHFQACEDSKRADALWPGSLRKAVGCKDGPRSPQDGPKITKDGPKMAKDDSKMAPRCPQDEPRLAPKVTSS